MIAREADRAGNSGLVLGLRLAWELGYIIAVPIAVFAFTGSWLDRMWGTSPWILLGGILLAAALSGIGVVRKVREIEGPSHSPRKI